MMNRELAQFIQAEIAAQMNLEIEMDCSIRGAGYKLYYYKGRYQKEKDLFK